MSKHTNPHLGPKVKCKECKRRTTYTTNINGICGRHPEGNANLNKARMWQMTQTYKVSEEWK